MIKKTFEDFILMLEDNSPKQSKLDFEDEECTKNILKIFIQDTGCVEEEYLKDIYQELEEYRGLIDWKDGILTIYFEHFYENIRHAIVSADTHGLDYDKFKAFFMNWLHNSNNGLEIEDYGDHLEVDFNCDL